MKSIRTDHSNHGAEGDERIRTAVCAPGADPAYVPWQTCPVCEGRGTMPCGFHYRLPVATGTAPESCKACGGRGMVLMARGGVS